MSQSSGHGEPLRFDPSFKGPLSRRSCTDVLCLLLFLTCLVAWLAIGLYAIKVGDLNRLLVPTDSEGRKCGVDADVLQKPYLLFFDLTKCASPAVPITGCRTPQMCIEKCPTENFIFGLDITPLAEIRRKLLCKPSVDKNLIQSNSEAAKLIRDDKCAPWYFKSEPLLNRCISELPPTECPPKQMECDNKNQNGHKIVQRKMNILDTWFSKIVNNIVVHFTNDKSAEQVGTMVVEDVIVCWWKILLGFVIAMLLCLIYIALMRWVASPMVWFSVFGVIGMLGYGLYLCISQYIYLNNKPLHREMSSSLSISGSVQSYLERKSTWIWIAVAVSVALLSILLTIIFLRKKIVIAIALIKEGSKAVSAVTSTLVFPIFPWIFQTLFIAYAIIIGLHLAAVGEPLYRVVGLAEGNCKCPDSIKDNMTCLPLDFNEKCRTVSNTVCTDATCQFLGISNPHFINYLQGINIFGFFWSVFFVSAFGEIVLAATFATWYWTFKKKDVPFFTLTVAIHQTIRYHLGTIAFGSLIIAICRMVRVILEYIDHKLKKYDNPCVRCILCCMKCFFWCLENFLKFINRNAYIMCAVHGKNFCASAKDAFSLLMRNIVRVFVLDKVTDFLFFLSKLLISALMGALAYAFFCSRWALSEDGLHYPMVPVLIIVIGTYFITCLFFGVYAMAVDTLFLCFLEDSERNDGSPEKPYYMSKQLMSILGRKNN